MHYSHVKVVVPARYSSSRLPGKPLLMLADKPMFWHVIDKIKNAGFKDEDIVLATDHDDIKGQAEQYGINVVMTDVSHPSGTDRINEVARVKGWCDDTLILNVQGDEPLIPSEIIANLTIFAQSNPHFDICTVVAPILEEEELRKPSVVKVALGENSRALYFSRSSIPHNRDDVSSFEYSYRHIGLYSYSVKALNRFCQFPESNLEKIEKLEQLRALSNGMSIGAMLYKNKLSHGVDTENDYLLVKSIMEK